MNDVRTQIGTSRSDVYPTDELAVRRFWQEHACGGDQVGGLHARVRTRLTLRDLPCRQLRQGSVLSLPFADDSFDLVFSHGVPHHVPDIRRAQHEIHRVLCPGGELVIMYARWSVNYMVSIGLIRRGALILAYPVARGGRGEPCGSIPGCPASRWPAGICGPTWFRCSPGGR